MSVKVRIPSPLRSYTNGVDVIETEHLTASGVRRFALAYVPPLAVGAVLTLVFTSHGLIVRLPGCWLLTYGAATTTGGALVPQPVAKSRTGASQAILARAGDRS